MKNDIESWDDLSWAIRKYAFHEDRSINFEKFRYYIKKFKPVSKSKIDYNPNSTEIIYNPSPKSFFRSVSGLANNGKVFYGKQKLLHIKDYTFEKMTYMVLKNEQEDYYIATLSEIGNPINKNVFFKTGNDTDELRKNLEDSIKEEMQDPITTWEEFYKKLIQNAIELDAKDKPLVTLDILKMYLKNFAKNYNPELDDSNSPLPHFPE